jgi:thiamine biosynthesis lipoprotein
VRVLIGADPTQEADARLALLRTEATMRNLQAKLTRFHRASELSTLNEDPAASVTVGPALAALVRGGVDAGRSSGGLVDFTLLDAIVGAGYARSRIGVSPAPLATALAAAPARRPAGPAPEAAWSRFEVDETARTVRRPPGIRIDGGGIAKGLAADLAAKRLAGFSSFAVDCGGDLAIGGIAGVPRRVDLLNPLRPGEALAFEVARGGVATSGIANRVWPVPGGYAHHLIDPATGEPAWTGVIQATALAPSAREAEVLAKTALLSGPEDGRSVLGPRGGVLVFDSGDIEVVGPVRSLSAPAGVPA